MIRLLFFVLLFFGFYAPLRAQQPQQPPQQAPTVDWKMGGQFVVSTDGESMFTNMGGPNVKIECKKIAFTVSMYPSLRFAFKDRPKPLVTPTLGAGAQLTIHRFILAMPCYYLANKQRWTMTLGIGYKF